jgi:hypothetical protein
MDNNISKFKINKIKLLSTWCFNTPKNNDCTICRINLNCKSIYSEDKCIESTITTMICGHSFHKECIDNWLKINNHIKCPICFTDLNYLKK